MKYGANMNDPIEQFDNAVTGCLMLVRDIAIMVTLWATLMTSGLSLACWICG
jgi:hypothetical protein